MVQRKTIRERPQIRSKSQVVLALGVVIMERHGGVGGGLWAPSAPKPPHTVGWLPVRVKKERGLGERVGASNRDFFFFIRKWNKLAPAHPISRFRERSQLYGLKKKITDAAIPQSRSILQLKCEFMAFRNADEAML